jgi:hypothetical protein
VNPKRGTAVQEQEQRMETAVNGKWPKVMLMSAATAAWLIYDISTATEAPRQALAILQYGLLACALFGLAGSLVIVASRK